MMQSMLNLLSQLMFKLFRVPYFFIKKRIPLFSSQIHAWALTQSNNRMLTHFNRLANFFFSHTLGSTKLDLQELVKIRQATDGTVIYLMRNWNQSAYNYFNRIFLKHGLPLAMHNNSVRMIHWMPLKEIWGVLLGKLDYFFTEGHWLKSEKIFSLPTALQKQEAFLYCLNLPEKISLEAMQNLGFFQELIQCSQTTPHKITLIPLHFIYDRHDRQKNKTLWDIFFGEKHNPSFIRKLIYFIRSFRKHAVASIGDPIDFKLWLNNEQGQNAQESLALYLHHIFYKESRAITGPRLKSRKYFIDEILNSVSYQNAITETAQTLGVSHQEMQQRGLQQLREIAGDMSSSMFELWELTLGWVFKNIYEGIELDRTGLAKIKKLIQDKPVILVPAHRSHMDYIILSYLFLINGISMPYICAGINLSIFPFGSVFRRSGAYFIRRSFGEDPLYPHSLKHYIKALTQHGCVQEFFIEGTRSRNGKMFPPKLGILSIYLEALLEGNISDITFVPVFIGYERIMEEKSYLEEIKGKTKKSESILDLFKIGKFLKRKYGKTYVQFGEALSLKQHLTNQGTQHNLQVFAENIIRSINQISPIFPSSLVAQALLSYGTKAMRLPQIMKSAEQLLMIAQLQGAHLADNLKQQPELAFKESLAKFVYEGLLQEHEDDGEKFYTLDSFNRNRMDYFKNASIQFFIHFSLWLYAYPLSANKTFLEIKNNYQRLASLLQYEFWPIDFATCTEQLLKLNWINQQDQQITLLANSEQAVLKNICLPYFEAYYVTLKIISKESLREVDEKYLIQQIQQKAEMLLLKGTLKLHESISKFSYKNALQHYLNIGLIRSHQLERGKKGKSIYSSVPDSKHQAQDILKLLENCLEIQNQDQPELRIINIA